MIRFVAVVIEAEMKQKEIYMVDLNVAAYEVLEQRRIEDIASDGYILRHKKSGARVCVISNDEIGRAHV